MEFLIHFNDKEGRPPTTRDFAKNPNYPNPYPYTLLFGSWDRAIEKAGLLNKRVRARSEKYTDEELLESLRRFEMEERRPPIEIDFINNPNYPGFTTFQRHFGSLERSKKLVRQDIDSMIIKGSLETNKQKARLAEIIVRDHLAGNTTDLSGKNCNSPYDGICPNNHIYDVKSSKLYDGIYFNFDLRNILIKHKINGFRNMSIPLIYKDEVAETIIVTRTQRIHHQYEDSISYFCHLSKNLWNQAHHLIYGYYKKYGHVPSYEDLDSILNKKSYYKDNKGKYNPDFDNYHKLGAIAQQILKVYIKAWISYLKGKKDYFENGDSKDYTGKPREPGYKKKDGEFELIFTNQQIKFIEKKDGSILMTFPKKIDNKPSKLNDLKILLGNVNNLDPYLLKRLMWNKFDQVRIVPKGTGYWIEIVYDQEVLKNASEIYGLDEDIIMSIDLGVENLAAITDNTGNRPIIIKTEILKSDNQWYNKRKGELQAIYDRVLMGCFLKRDKDGNIRYIVNKIGKKMDILTENRNNIVMDDLHKVSRYLISHALSIKSKTIAFVRNPGWKQKVNMGKRVNQNFAQIPYKKLIDMTRYKGEECGIDVVDDTEEYTSKCSFPDSEDICFHKEYKGKRIFRGLFEASKGFRINADVDGSYNFLRKIADKVLKIKTKFDYVYPKFDILDIIEGVVVHGLVPKRLSISDLMTKSYHDLGMNR